jgi:hypothetical protein
VKRLLRNAAICTVCRDEIESKHRLDYQKCSCGSIWISGGTEDDNVRGAIGNCIIDTSLWDSEDDRGWDE